MQKLYRLVNHEVRGLYRYVLLSALAMAVLQNVMISLYLKRYESVYDRFEDILSKSGIPLVFIVAFAVTIGFCIMGIYSNYTGGKSIYTLLTLPHRREYVYLSKIAAFLICLLILWSTQIISIFFGYGLMVSSLRGRGFDPMINGLFLSFVRSDFLRIIVPFGVRSILFTGIMVISFISTVYYGVLCERSRKFKRLIMAFVNMGLAVYTLNNRISTSVGRGYGYPAIDVIILMQLALTVYIVFDSIKMVKQGSIA